MPQLLGALGRLAASAMIAGALSGACEAAEFSAGGFSFSDELGGFRLLSASGKGTKADPVIVVEEFDEAAPVTLVIRRHRGRGESRSELYAELVLEKIVVNLSNRVWAGFEVELQEISKQPSVYADGLSFNQFGTAPPDVSSDSFADNNRLFEPYDRIRFESGHVDPGATARFKITITDPTPVAKFYLVQDPKLLSAGLPAGSSLAVRTRPEAAIAIEP